MDGENSLDEDSRSDVSPRFADDGFYRALAEQPRRYVLSYLLNRGGCSVEELADVLGGWESTTDSILSPERREQIRLELEHNHLPHLDDRGLLTYDRAEQRVTVADLDAEVKALLHRSIEAEQA